MNASEAVVSSAGHSRWKLLLPILGIILTSATAASGENRVTAGARIRVLYLGDTFSFSQNKIILGWVEADPKFTLAVVPCDLEVMTTIEAKKFTRLYLPRSYADMNNSYDVLVMNNISPRVIPDRVLTFFQRGIRDDGLGAYLVSFLFWGGRGQGTNDIQTWMSIPFYEVLPCDVDMSTDVDWTQGKIHYKILKRQPILDMPGLENVVMFMHHGGDIIPRLGTTVHAVWRERGTPVLVSGSYGRGITLELDQAWNDIPVPSLQSYRYFPDLVYNQLFFVVGLKPPQDLELAHEVRHLFIETRLRKKITLSTLDFVQKFGGNTIIVERELSSLDKDRQKAKDCYVKGDLDGASKLLKKVMAQYPVIDDRMQKIKDKALFWIHSVEWMVTTSTFIIVGLVLWSIMVRRKLYRETRTTRFRSRT